MKKVVCMNLLFLPLIYSIRIIYFFHCYIRKKLLLIKLAKMTSCKSFHITLNYIIIFFFTHLFYYFYNKNSSNLNSGLI